MSLNNSAAAEADRLKSTMYGAMDVKLEDATMMDMMTLEMVSYVLCLRTGVVLHECVSGIFDFSSC